jgi:hypothetical protein
MKIFDYKVWTEETAKASNAAKVVRVEEAGEVAIEAAERLLAVAHNLAGVACRSCGGLGKKCYGSTSTWGGGAGGMMMTEGTCDVCWGTGRTDKIGPNLRKMRGAS